MEYLSKILDSVDVVTVSTPHMAKIASQYTAKPIVIVADPYEGQKGIATSNQKNNLNLLWYGHTANLDTIETFIPLLLNADLAMPVNFRVIISEIPEIRSAVKDFWFSAKRCFILLIPFCAIDIEAQNRASPNYTLAGIQKWSEQLNPNFS